MPDTAYILHCFSRFHQQRCLIYIIGRLENGETFGFVDQSFQPFFYIRQSDQIKAKQILASFQLRAINSTKFTMDDEACLQVRHADKKRLKKAVEELHKNEIRTYEGDVKVELQYLMDLRLRSTCQIEGTWQKGQGVDRLYRNAKLTPTEAIIGLKTVVLECHFSDDLLQSFSLSELNDSHEITPKILSESIGQTADQFPEERLKLLKLKDDLKAIDPDIICAWQIQESLDKLKWRFKAHKISFNLGRSREGAWFTSKQFRGQELCVIQGRQILDIETLMQHTWERYEESSPESIIKAVLHKDVPEASSKNVSLRCQLLSSLLRKKNLVELTLRRSLLTGLSLERCWGSIAAFEYLYIQELHKQNYLAPSLGIDRRLTGASPGGLVMPASGGFHRNIFVFDFKSLYPSIIRSFNIDPLAYARAQAKISDKQDLSQLLEIPNGTRFDRRPAILPETLKRFFASREDAKKDKDELASFVCKILMNSFFGVLGTPGCRFAQADLVASVSQTSHYLLRWVRSLLEEQGYRVLYGDTDSLFVDLNESEELSYQDAQEKGEEMHKSLNEKLRQHLHQDFQITESCLDLEFEKYYPKFFQPNMRNDSGQGRAKSYAALKSTPSGNELEIVGLEAVRRDWTAIARDLQTELLQMIFDKVDAQKIEEHIQKLIKELKLGLHDDKLIYRKRLRKSLEAYTKTTPPHIKAARQLKDCPRVIFYYITSNGPEPKELLRSAIDYQHYIDKQISPIVKSLAEHSSFSYEKAVSSQQSLF
mgnify:CR=1 FL=1